MGIISNIKALSGLGIFCDGLATLEETIGRIVRFLTTQPSGIGQSMPHKDGRRRHTAQNNEDPPTPHPQMQERFLAP